MTDAFFFDSLLGRVCDGIVVRRLIVSFATTRALVHFAFRC